MNRGNGFNGYSKKDFRSIRYPSKNASCIIFLKPFLAQRVISLRPKHSGHSKPSPYFNSSNRPDAHQPLCQICFQLIKDRVAQARRTTPHKDFHNSSQRISSKSRLFDLLLHGDCSPFIWTEQKISFPFFKAHLFRPNSFEFDGISHHLNLFSLKDLLGDSPCSHSSDALPR